MSDHTPPFDEIVDRDDPERDRLHEAHLLLAAAGAPPELPPWLASAPPEPRAQVVALRRRRFTVLATAAVAATMLFGIGYALGGRDRPPAPVQTVAMNGGGGATAWIDVFSRDEAGNWPMTLSVSGLAPLPKGQTYALWLTLNGKLAEPCGTFAVAPGTTKVPLSAPYPLKDYDGWVVVRSGTQEPFVLRTGTV
jgi:hypothetical protein